MAAGTRSRKNMEEGLCNTDSRVQELMNSHLQLRRTVEEFGNKFGKLQSNMIMMMAEFQREVEGKTPATSTEITPEIIQDSPRQDEGHLNRVFNLCNNHNSFGESYFNKDLAEFNRLQQITTDSHYQKRFEFLRSLIEYENPGLTEAYFVKCFIDGLKEEIGEFVKLLRPKKLCEAISVARVKESIVDASFKRTKTLLISSSLVNNSFQNGEKRSQLQQLNVEYQRLLRETRGVESNDSEKGSTQEKTVDKLADGVQVEANTVTNSEDLESSLDVSTDGVKESGDTVESGTQSSQENVKSQMGLDEEVTPAFRASVDTQDLFGDSQTSDIKDDQPKDHHSSAMEEVLAPSLLAMNLKFDFAPLNDEISSDKEENDKENLDSLIQKPGDGCSSPKRDPVKTFVDEEAEEEDDNDNDLFCFQENEEDENTADSEELNDLIVTGYEEKSIDDGRHNELHQKWFEQQDAAGSDNLMQRLKCGPKVWDTAVGLKLLDAPVCLVSITLLQAATRKKYGLMFEKWGLIGLVNFNWSCWQECRRLVVLAAKFMVFDPGGRHFGGSNHLICFFNP